MTRRLYIKLKKDVTIDDMVMMHPALHLMYAFLNYFCHVNDIDFVVTSLHRTLKENKAVGAKSLTHVEDRAFDISLKSEHGWNKNLISELKQEIEDNFSDIGALSASSGEARPIVIHDVGSGTHAHLQIRRGL